MKKILVAFAVAAFAVSASALVNGGPHDMRQQTPAGTQGVCLYCHAAHLWSVSNIGAGTGAPLWNRNQSSVITPYGTTVAGTVVGQPGAQSRTCLSCHDGVTDLGAVNNGVAETLGAIKAHSVGTTLTNDHPVGVVIPATADYKTPVVGVDAVKLSTTNTVECSSCHEPHNGVAGDKFLRVAGGNFCDQCHQK
ncbi:cytochrome c3 family protein [Anaeromyxobacter oryzisoli]|uniref:cytochrome c3 family protein n=1 Tax=Anaeromyxobacter oryzisoli TaxID=2925408 RepID=UPI001F580473|nr:cytochrome c3 family protein [Anaeromyxobacter sp. SG63]